MALAEAAVAGCVSNLPFGQQFNVPGDVRSWLRQALGEIARVVRPGGRVVLLAPDLPAAVLPASLVRSDRIKLRLLGTPASLWAFDRR